MIGRLTLSVRDIFPDYRRQEEYKHRFDGDESTFHFMEREPNGKAPKNKKGQKGNKSPNDCAFTWRAVGIWPNGNI